MEHYVDDFYLNPFGIVHVDCPKEFTSWYKLRVEFKKLNNYNVDHNTGKCEGCSKEVPENFFLAWKVNYDFNPRPISHNNFYISPRYTLSSPNIVQGSFYIRSKL